MDEPDPATKLFVKQDGLPEGMRRLTWQADRPQIAFWPPMRPIEERISEPKITMRDR